MLIIVSYPKGSKMNMNTSNREKDSNNHQAIATVSAAVCTYEQYIGYGGGRMAKK
jgi:hypothetical protein